MQLDLDRAARTVADIGAHMSRMRDNARSFQHHFEAESRGYFIPSEEDAVFGLWVSYHKARNALLDLIASIRAEMGEGSEETLVEFTIGYGAVVVLIDAARFLRDLFSQDDIVRRKLNESLEHFGIPSGSFDSIQMSLTNPSNALKILDANAFFDRHQVSIQALAEGDPQLRRVLTIIETRGEKLRVAIARYVKVRIGEQRRRFNDAIVQGGILRAIYAIQEWGSRFVSSLSTMPRHVPTLPDSIAANLEQLSRPGDVFVTRKESAVTNYFLPGYWPHAALHVGEGSVIESLKDGVRRRGLDSPFGNDAVCMIRPRVEPDIVAQAIGRAETHIGKPYDFDFDFTRSDRLVCTEVVYRGFEGLGGIQFQLSRRAGRQTLSAEDLLNMALLGQHFELCAVFCPKHSNELLQDGRMIDVLRETMENPSV